MSTVKPMELIHASCPDFKWYEVWKSSTASRLRITNVATSQLVILDVRKLVVNLLQPLRDDLGSIKPQSWYRGEKLERVITRDSYLRWCERNKIKATKAAWMKYFALKSHPKGQAVDIEVTGLSNDDLYEHIRKHYEFDQLIREFRVAGVPDSGWVHVSWAGSDNRNKAFKTK